MLAPKLLVRTDLITSGLNSEHVKSEEILGLVNKMPALFRICASLVARPSDVLVFGVGGFARFVAASIAVLVASSCLYCSSGVSVRSEDVGCVVPSLRA